MSKDGNPRRKPKAQRLTTEHGRKTSDGMHAGDGERDRDDYRTFGGRLEDGFQMIGDGDDMPTDAERERGDFE